jgi:hypothetical protein
VCFCIFAFFCLLELQQQHHVTGSVDLHASIETVEDNLVPEFYRPVYAAPSLMSIRSCFVVQSNGQPQLPMHYAQSQPQLSHGYSQPFLSRVSNSADHLVTSSLSQLNSPSESSAALLADNSSTMYLPFHEQVKNSAHKLPVMNQQQQIPVAAAVCTDATDVNVIGTAVRIQVSLNCYFLSVLFFSI